MSSKSVRMCVVSVVYRSKNRNELSRLKMISVTSCTDNGKTNRGNRRQMMSAAMLGKKRRKRNEKSARLRKSSVNGMQVTDILI